jgi:hypothetical protein
MTKIKIEYPDIVKETDKGTMYVTIPKKAADIKKIKKGDQIEVTIEKESDDS